jgi:hypothetical protein
MGRAGMDALPYRTSSGDHHKMVIKDGIESLGGTGPDGMVRTANDSGHSIPWSTSDALDAELPLHKKSFFVAQLDPMRIWGPPKNS